jgi:tRNA (guanine37-N1)-methyltransferase
MVMLAEPLAAAIHAAKQRQAARGMQKSRVVYLSPQGRLLTHAMIRERVTQQDEGLILLAGRYEGVDERLVRRYVDDEISIGDYVLSGGELAAMVLIDSVVRQLPGVLGDDASAEQDSFVQGLLDCPHYTRPEVFSGSEFFDGEAVPPVLLSGNHAEIERWRLQQSLGRTWLRRPDLLAKRDLTKEESRLLAAFQKEQDPDN